MARGDVLARYDEMREAALADAEDRLYIRTFGRRGIPIRLSLIDADALQAWQDQWRPRPDRPGGWNWREQRLALRSTLNRFEVALWSGPILCGLAIGKPSAGPTHLMVKLIEGNPADAHPLKTFVAECVVEAGISYGRLLEKTTLKIHKPLPGALPSYRRLGLGLSRKARTPHIAFWRYEPMAEASAKLGFMTKGPLFGASSHHASGVAGFRARLADRKSPLDNLSPEQLEQARKEFRELPEVAGAPYRSVRRK